MTASSSKGGGSMDGGSNIKVPRNDTGAVAKIREGSHSEDPA